MPSGFVRLVALVLLVLNSHALAEERELLLTTTTSVQDSGLLDALLPELEKHTGVKVRVIAVGSGAALRMGAEGNADLVLSHAPAAEEALLQTGAFSARHPFMENFFLIAGPPDDPAKVKQATSGADAFRRIAAAQAPWASRGDDSGTHKQEQALLKAAGLDPKPSWKGVVSTGAGMGQTLLIAGEKRAYTLSDLGTFLAFEKRSELVRLSHASDDLRNVYSLLTVNPEKHPGRIRSEAANAVLEWFLRPTSARAIAEFGRAKYGEPLFRPLELDAD